MEHWVTSNPEAGKARLMVDAVPQFKVGRGMAAGSTPCTMWRHTVYTGGRGVLCTHHMLVAQHRVGSMSCRKPLMLLLRNCLLLTCCALPFADL